MPTLLNFICFFNIFLDIHDLYILYGCFCNIIMYKSLILSLVLILTLCQKNYQQRSIFYSRADNLCCNSQHRDQFNLIINLDDSDQIRRVVDGGSSCGQWYLFCADAVSPNDIAGFLEGSSKNVQTRIIFDQEIVKRQSFGLVSHITLKVTVQNPVKILDNQYTCTILGDGTEHHWGTDFDEFAPAEVYMRCISIKSPKESIQSQISSQ